MFNRNYINHIALSILICVAIPAAILFGIMQLDQNAYTKYHVSQVASQHIDNKVIDIKNWMDGKTYTIDQYGVAIESYIAQYGFDNKINGFLTEMSEADKDITHLYLTTETGSQYISGDTTPVLDGRTRPWYVGGLKEDLYISAPYKDILTNQLVVTFSKSIRDKKGRLQAVVAMDVLLDKIVKKIEHPIGEDRYSIIIQSEDGSVPYSSETFVGSSLDEILDQPTDQMDINLNETRYTGMKYVLPNMHTTMYVFLSMDKYYEPIHAFNREFLMNTLIILIGLIGVIRIGASLLLSPLNRMSLYITNATEKVENNRIPILPEDLKDILSHFIQLDKNLEDRKIEITQMNKHVHEHNNEISSSNTALEASFNELKMLKGKLEVQEEQYYDLVNNIPDLIWICDANGYLIYGNEVFENKIGKSVRQEDRLRISDIIEGLPSSKDRIKLFLDRDYSKIELSFVDSDLISHEMEGSITRIYESDRLIAVQGIFRDTSEARNMYFDYYNRNRELTLVNDITKSLISNTELDVVLTDIANKVGQIMSVSLCTIRLLKDDHFELVASSGAREQIIFDVPPSLESSHMGLAYKENRLSIINGEIDFVIEDPDLYEAMEHLTTVVYIPLATNDNVYGIISIGTDQELKLEKIKILETLADQAAIAIERKQIFEKLRTHYFKTIEALVAANDAKVPNMEGHTKRVSDIAVEVGKRMYLRKKDIDDIYIAGLLHDIGKMNIPDTLLSKKNDLTQEEANEMDKHPMYAKKILEPIGMSQAITEGIYYHHKKYNLSGEPRDEKINSLPLIARIIGVVDDLDGLLAGRLEYDVMPLEQAMVEIRKGAGAEYCPEVVRILDEMAKLSPDLITDHYKYLLVDTEVTV